MGRLTGWWSRRSNPEKLELYTRWTFHAIALGEVVVIGPVALGGTPAPLGGWLFLLVCAHSLLGGVVASRALSWTLDRRKRPRRLMAAYALLTGGAGAGLMVLHRLGALGDPPSAETMSPGVICFGVAHLVLCLSRVRHMLYLVLATATGTGLVCAVLTLPPRQTAGYALAVFIGGLATAFTSGFSGWLLKAVWELDAARELQARLAVAEERLRFGRDLHDVMGRNLSVIALKSELAVQLARRGLTDRAVEQMAEVQHIARDSQREVRDVVRGYREADLRTELDGARSVLAAAGIACTVESAAPAAGTALPAPVQSALGWVVREATTNVLRHGDARRCAITVTVTEGCAVLVVENDGAGAAGGGPGTPASGPPGQAGDGGPGEPAGQAGSAGTGLAGLRERLTALDGTLEAGRLAGGRFRLTARVPAAGPPGTGDGGAPDAGPGGVAAGRTNLAGTGAGRVGAGAAGVGGAGGVCGAGGVGGVCGAGGVGGTGGSGGGGLEGAL
ncbi:sensor histidine kinase [Streptomyces sp. HMX112]|uniref:sensor histidine kinase n=1 Tax=Streptomyces sp. HMX112 TaxID=3390850 RepID=UPI003A7F6ABF